MESLDGEFVQDGDECGCGHTAQSHRSQLGDAIAECLHCRCGAYVPKSEAFPEHP